MKSKDLELQIVSRLMRLSTETVSDLELLILREMIEEHSNELIEEIKDSKDGDISGPICPG